MIVIEKEMEGYKIQVSHEEKEMEKIAVGPLDEVKQELGIQQPEEVKQESFWRWFKNGLTWSKNK